jgi:hypothetical protein
MTNTEKNALTCSSEFDNNYCLNSTNDVYDTTYNDTSDNVFDPNFWAELDTIQKCYYIGFLTADGYILKPNTLGVHLSIRDYTWLVNYKKNLNLNTKISITDGRPIRNSIGAMILKRNTQWTIDLFKYGMVNCKTGKEHIPFEYAVNEKEISAMLLGFHDGDCSIHKHDRNSNYYVFSICANKMICNDINNILHEYIGTDLHKISIHDKNRCDYLYRTQFSAKQDLINLYDFMYGLNPELENCWLSRKHGTWCNFMLDATRAVV